MDALGNSMQKRHHSRMDPVTKSHQAEVLGDICQREHPPGGEPEHDARADMTYWLPLPTWQTKEVPHELSKTKRGGWDHPGQGWCGSQMSPPLKPHLQQLLSGRKPPQWALSRETACHQCQHLPTTINAWRSGTLPLACLRLDRVVNEAWTDTVLVGGAHKGPWLQRPPRIHPEGVYLLWGA